MVVSWTGPAKSDLRAIHDFIAADSKYYAKKVVRDIIAKTSILEAYPLIGRKTPEIDDEKIREIFVYSYRILYEIQSDQVFVIGVIHGRRDFALTHVDRVKETT
ncbi:MAG: type II toxin-antitoxin system RelE/ParE family toxin [Pseudomonadota bacterium]|nr:type II toxin-antitoxin system RelE/ParE family toxin [Pseudomonadota bacterium]